MKEPKLGVLNGRVAIVTGAGGGIGREHALLLAAEGASVVVNDLGGASDGTGSDQSRAQSVVEEITALGGKAVADGHDVADAGGAAALVSLALESFGDLHVLVNNAGILRDRSLMSMTDEDWDLSIRVNLRGTFLPAREAGRYWRTKAENEPADAVIINTSSESGIFGNAGQSNYAAAKAGVASLTEVWHKELFRYGVRVCGILPRARTRLTDSPIIGRPDEGFDVWDPANLSPFVAYLATKDCLISGQLFMVWGGMVQRATPWTLDRTWMLKQDGRWTALELAKAVAEAGVPNNDGRDTGVTKPHVWGKR